MFEISASIDTAGFEYEDVVESVGYAIPVGSTTFDPFALETPVELSTPLPAAELATVPIPSVPGASLIVSVTGGDLETSFLGTCARAGEGAAQFVGQYSVAGRVELSATVELSIPIVGTQTFGPFDLAVDIPRFTRAIDMGTYSLQSGERVDGVLVCGDSADSLDGGLANSIDAGEGRPDASGPRPDGGPNPRGDGGTPRRDSGSGGLDAGGGGGGRDAGSLPDRCVQRTTRAVCERDAVCVWTACDTCVPAGTSGRLACGCSAYGSTVSCDSADASGCRWESCVAECVPASTDTRAACSCGSANTLTACNGIAGCAWYSCAETCLPTGTPLHSVCGCSSLDNVGDCDAARNPRGDRACAWYACAGSCLPFGSDIDHVCP